MNTRSATSLNKSVICDNWIAAEDEIICYLLRNGDQIWSLRGVTHRTDGPAIIYANGDVVWVQRGRIHRDPTGSESSESPPAVIYANGDKEWYFRGNLHRDNDLPAVEYMDGTRKWYREGKQHRTGLDKDGADLPAVIRADGTLKWCVNGERHRENGPAVIYPNGNEKWYWKDKLFVP